jgi:hypothetical protein
MTITEFFNYLLGREQSRALALQLVEVYAGRASRRSVIAPPGAALARPLT